MINVKDDYTEFYYTQNNIFNLAAQSILRKIQAGNPAGHNRVSLTEEDRPLAMKFMKEAAAEIYKEVSSMGMDTDYSYEFSGLHNGTPPTTGSEICYRIVFPNYWVENMNTGLDVNLEAAIVSYLVKLWYQANGLMNEFDQEENNYRRILSNLHDTFHYRYLSTRRYRYY